MPAAASPLSAPHFITKQHRYHTPLGALARSYQAPDIQRGKHPGRRWAGPYGRAALGRQWHPERGIGPKGEQGRRSPWGSMSPRDGPGTSRGPYVHGALGDRKSKGQRPSSGRCPLPAKLLSALLSAHGLARRRHLASDTAHVGCVVGCPRCPFPGLGNVNGEPVLVALGREEGPFPGGQDKG